MGRSAVIRMKLVGMSRVDLEVLSFHVFVLSVAGGRGCLGALMSGSCRVGVGGFGRDWEETSSGFDESRS